ncbi:HD domain-containing phosphohydrolase [Actinoplanes sp. NPDC051633]|uniref:HD domain-containing phosphohydrolase n=1 Tax=Actinoplanes sp. NPDC051633 TaxID=3155670 RepID=UPI0034349677
MTLPRVLFVDDEPHLLNGLRRQLRRDFDVVTAVGAANGLFSLGRDEPFEVIVSDFLMPGINGAEFLAAVRKAAPDATRMLLTGHTNLPDAATTVNEGGIFRMLLKPVDQTTLTAALHDCVAQHRLVIGERELLEQTLRGCVHALVDVLSLANPAAFARATRMRRTAVAVLDRVAVADRWAVELSVMMSQLGAVSLPPSVVERLGAAESLTAAEQRMVDEVPDVAERLIAPIPRLTAITDAIRYSRRNWDGSGPPGDNLAGEDIPFGARLLHIVQDLDSLICEGVAPGVACVTLRSRPGHYDPVLLDALTDAVQGEASTAVSAVALADLRIGMVLAAPVRSGTGTLLVNPGQEVTTSLMSRLRNFATLDDGVAEPVMVYPPGTDVTAAT